MGMTFTALSAVSLSDISREKMAQASAITNSIRQLGGSLGVAILATMLTTRINYHTQVFGGSIESQSEVFKQTVKNIKGQIQYNSGSYPLDAPEQSQYMLLSNVSKQAYIEGINDDFLIAGIITAVGVIPILFLRTKKSENSKPQKNEEQIDIG
jgi:DHA2 family multidrug resistance protein